MYPIPNPNDPRVIQARDAIVARLLAPSPSEASPWIGMPMVDFIRDVLGIDMWDAQVEIVESIDHNPATAVKSCHGSGKSYIMAAVVLAFLHTRAPSVAITTAPTNRQVRGILWRNIRAIYRRSREPLLGRRPLQMEYSIADDHFAMGFKGSDENADSMQGFHSPHLLAVIDEAAGVAENVINGMDNIATGEGSRLVYIGNPTSVSGRFRKAFHQDRELFHTISIRAEDTPNIKAGRTVIPGLVDQSYVDRMIRVHGETSPYVRSRVFAEFPDQADDTLISLADIERCEKQRPDDVEWTKDAPFRCGVDVARTGSDESVIWIRSGDVTVYRAWVSGNDTMQVVGRVRAALDVVAARYDVDPYTIPNRVDVIGVGSGVADRLRELGYAVVDVNVSSRSTDREKYPNLRNELWWNLAERFRASRIAFVENHDHHDAEIDEQTVAQLSAVRAKYQSMYSRPVVESKDDMKKRLGRSPDRAEAMMLAYADDFMVNGEDDVPPLDASAFRLAGTTGWMARAGR